METPVEVRLLSAALGNPPSKLGVFFFRDKFGHQQPHAPLGAPVKPRGASPPGAPHSLKCKKRDGRGICASSRPECHRPGFYDRPNADR